MPKSTRWLLIVIICLTIGCTITGYLWWRTPAQQKVKGVTVKQTESLGLPDLIGQNADNVLEGKSAVILSQADNQIMYDYNAFERAPMASLTKLMTAIVALDYGLDYSKAMHILPEEYGVGGNLTMYAGETATVQDLFYASLLGSANNATRAYVRSLEEKVSTEEFVRAMNRKAVELELEQTHFTDVTGLDTTNISTAYEVALMAKAAFMYPDIAKATSAPTYTFVFGESGREHQMNNTNKMITENNQDFSGSKTGFLYEAGYCLVTQTKTNEPRIVVIMDSPSEEAQYRDMQRLLNLPTW